MSTDRCLREDELLDALGRGYVGPELTAHAAECAACSELSLVAGALLDDRREAVADAHVPSAGAMRLRLQMRLRRDAEAATRRSLLIGYAITLVMTIGLTVALLGTSVAVEVHDLITSIRLGTPMLLGLLTWLVLAPIAGYVVIRQK